MSKHFSILITSMLLLCTACAAGGSHRPFIRLNAIAWDETDAEINVLGYGSLGVVETDHSSIEIGGGAAQYDENGNKTSTVEILLAQSEFYDVDAVEISAGGRYFLSNLSFARMFGSLHLVGTNFDDDLGTQIGLRAGMGAEVPLNPNVFLDLNLNYLFPVEAADDDVFGLVETEVDGISFRLGVGFDF